MNSAHQRGQASTSSVQSFDESNEHATDYISGIYQDASTGRPYATLHHHHSVPSPTRKKVVPPPPPPKPGKPNTSSPNSPYSNSSTQSTPSGSTYQRSLSSGSNSSSPERKSPPITFPRSPPAVSTPMPLAGLRGDDHGSSPSSPAEIAKELSNLQAFKRMSLDAVNLVSDPDLPSTRMSAPDFTELMEAGVDQDAARLLWVPGPPFLIFF